MEQGVTSKNSGSDCGVGKKVLEALDEGTEWFGPLPKVGMDSGEKNSSQTRRKQL